MIGSLAILAETPYDRRMRSLSQAFQGGATDSSETAHSLIFILAMLVILAVGVLVFRAYQQRTVRRSSLRPVRFFSRALKQLGLPLSDRILLRLVARKCGLEHPTVMLLSPSLLEQHTGAWADRLSFASLRRRVRSRIGTIVETLFGEARRPHDDGTAKP